MAIRSISRASVWLSATAAALLSFPAPASAQSAPVSAGSLAWSKSEAILGAPSALQAILAQQGAPARGPVATVAPAAYSAPRVANAVLRRNPTGEGILSGRPDVFGSVALRVGHTPLDARWHSVEHARVTGRAAHFAQTVKDATPLKQLEAVNWYVNRRVQFVDDIRRFGRADVWSSASETLRNGRGDCEDFAIAKMQMLRAAGFSDRDLYLVVLRDLVRRSDHAVLVARASGRMVVLDNGTDELLDTNQVNDYRPILTFASYGEWTHGYRVTSAPIEVAANELPVDAKPVIDQRSRSASLLAFNTGFKR
jgi:predicted transglutaminase-like cysteine proteinase